jgi:hypothetical protein
LAFLIVFLFALISICSKTEIKTTRKTKTKLPLVAYRLLLPSCRLILIQPGSQAGILWPQDVLARETGLAFLIVLISICARTEIKAKRKTKLPLVAYRMPPPSCRLILIQPGSQAGSLWPQGVLAVAVEATGSLSPHRPEVYARKLFRKAHQYWGTF